MSGSNVQNSNDNQISKPSTGSKASVKLEKKEENVHGLNPKDQWETSVENDQPNMKDDKTESNLNW